MITFNDFNKKIQLKKQSKIKWKNLSNPMYLFLSNVGIYLRDGPFPSDIVIVNLHPSKRTHWVCYINKTFYNSYGCVCPKKLSKYIIKRNVYCLYSEYQIQKKLIFLCKLFFIYNLFAKAIGIDFKSALRNL